MPAGFPFWLTQFPTSEAYPAVAGRFEPALAGWPPRSSCMTPPMSVPGETSVAIQAPWDHFMRPHVVLRVVLPFLSSQHFLRYLALRSKRRAPMA